MNHTNGKIAAQSRQKLAAGLLKVMEQYDFHEITVTQICQEAQLSRKTFYRLFSGKDAVLRFLLEQLSIECVAQLRARQIVHYWDAVQLYFDFCEAQKELLLLLRRHGLLGVLFEVSYRHAWAAFEAVRSEETAQALAGPLPYLLAYSIGGMNSMLLKWIEDGMRMPSSELIATLRAGFLSPAL